MKTSDAAQAAVRGAVRHLNSGGELRIVANAFRPISKILLDETLASALCHRAKPGAFVYRTVMTRQAKK